MGHESRFYLAGGTAVALHLGHRESADFDWFSKDLISDPERRIVEFENVVGAEFVRQHVAPGTILGFVKGVKVSFFHLPYALLDAPTEWSGCALASLDDLVAMKLLAMAQRGTKRDFIDVHALFEAYSLIDMICLFQAKYPQGSVPHLMRSLVYFDDAERDPMPRMFRRVRWHAVKRDITREVAHYDR